MGEFTQYKQNKGDALWHTTLNSFIDKVDEWLDPLKGSTADPPTRINVSIADDGSLKSGAPSSDWWQEENESISKVSSTQFKVLAVNDTSIYTHKRAVRLTVDGAMVYSHVKESSYDGTDTTVTIYDPVISGTLTKVEFGQQVTNSPLPVDVEIQAFFFAMM